MDKVRIIETNGITDLKRLEGSDLYYGLSLPYGDLYEAKELFDDCHEIDSNRLIFISYPEGEVYEPIRSEKGIYFEEPVYDAGRIYILYCDFSASKIHIASYDGRQSEDVAVLDLKEVKDCYNLKLAKSPITLIRQGHENDFDVLWPEKGSFHIEKEESLDHRNGDLFYFSRWFEDPDYREETYIRSCPEGKLLETVRGSVYRMPDGTEWILK